MSHRSSMSELKRALVLAPGLALVLCAGHALADDADDPAPEANHMRAQLDSNFIMGGATVDGPGDGFEVDGLFYMGTRLDIRFGDHWALGADVAFMKFLSSSERSLDAGVHFGHAWR